MRRGVYKEHGIGVRNHCRTEPPRDPESAGLVTTVGGRDRAAAWHAAADGVQAPARAARGRFRGVYGGCTAPSLQAETSTTGGGGCLAGSVSPALVRSPGCSGTPSRGRFRGVYGGCTAPSLQAETSTTGGGGCLAGSVSPALVRSPGCSGTPS